MTRPDKEKPTPIPCVCGRGGDYRENEKRQNDLMPEPGEMSDKSADHVAQR